MRRHGLIAAIALACLGAVSYGMWHRSRQWRGPLNIVMVVIDTLRADHLDLYGYDRPTMPHLAEYARDAAVYESAYAHAPWTKPSVATMMTSLLPRDHGIQDWEHMLDGRHYTLPLALKDAGYSNEGYVSHHAFDPGENNNFHLGFDVFDVSSFAGRGSPHHIHSSRQVTTRAIEGLRRLEARRKPFFLWVHYFDPHDSYLEHEQFEFGADDQARYDSEIAWTDLQLKRLLRAIDELGLDDHTVVGVTADHGEEFLDHGGTLHAYQMYDEVLRVPLVIKAPSLTAQRVVERVGLIDLAPTMLSLAGLPIPDRFEGEAPVLDQGVIVTNPRPIFAETQRFHNRRMVLEGNFKLIEDQDKNRFELYDMANDPGEKRNLMTRRPNEFRRLRQLLAERHAAPPVELPRHELGDDMKQLLEELGYVDPPPGAE